MSNIYNSRDKIYKKIIASKNVIDFNNFAVREIEFYNWLTNNQIHYLKSNYSELIRLLVAQKLEFLSSISVEKNIETARDLLSSYHRSNIPYRDDLCGLFLDKITDTDLTRQNFRKLIFIYSGSSFISEFQLRSTNLTGGELVILTNELAWCIQQRDDIENIRISKDTKIVDGFLSYINNSIDDLGFKHKEISTIHDKYIKQFNEEHLRRKRRVKSLINLFENQSRLVIKEIHEKRKEYEDLKASFIDYMHMKAPADYWSTRSKDANWSRIIYAVAFVISLILIICTFKFSIIPWLQPAIDTMVKSDKYPVFEVSVFISLSAFVFWMLRIVARLALSSHHLKIDADERNVMIKTYLALIKEGAASENEREIILQTIFKPTSDGIVKEDPQYETPLLSIARNKISGN